MLFALGILAFYHPVNLMQKSAGALLDDGTGMETPEATSSRKLNTCLPGLKRGHAWRAYLNWGSQTRRNDEMNQKLGVTRYQNGAQEKELGK
jgi:hypothetical protein